MTKKAATGGLSGLGEPKPQTTNESAPPKTDVPNNNVDIEAEQNNNDQKTVEEAKNETGANDQQSDQQNTEPEKRYFTEEHLKANPLFEKFGFKVGDEITEEKGEQFNVWVQNLVTQDDLNNNPDYVSAGVLVNDTPEEFNAKIDAYEQALTDKEAQELKDLEEQNKAKGNKSKKLIFHGDFLTESQMNEEITFDWNEVTAPQHLVHKPENI